MIKVKNLNLEKLGVIEKIKMLKTAKGYSRCKSFETSCPFTQNNFDLLKIDNIIIVDDFYGVIETIAYEDNYEGDFNIIVLGRELKSLLDRRIVWNTLSMNTTAELYLRKAVEDNIINPTNADRKIDVISLGAVNGISTKIDKQDTGSNILELCEEVCMSCELGFDLIPDGNKLKFVVYSGKERDIKFSDRFDNVASQDLTVGTGSYKNTCLIAGEDKGEARKRTSIEREKGLQRREVYIDARDLQQEENTASMAYTNILLQRGNERLAEMSRTQTFDCEIIESNVKYGVDFNLGDIVTVINDKLKFKQKERINAIERVYQNNSVSINIIFGEENV